LRQQHKHSTAAATQQHELLLGKLETQISQVDDNSFMTCFSRIENKSKMLLFWLFYLKNHFSLFDQLLCGNIFLFAS